MKLVSEFVMQVILVKQELRELKTFMDQLQDIEVIEEEAMELEDSD